MPTTCRIGSTDRREPHLIIPYTLDANDMRFINAQGFGHGDEFFAYLKDAFDVLYAEGETRAQDDVGRAALPAGGPAGKGGGRSTRFSTIIAAARRRVDRAQARHRAPLASRASRARRAGARDCQQDVSRIGS